MSQFSEAHYARVASLPGFLQPPRYSLIAPLVYEVGWEGSGWEIVIPAGFEFDLSAPWWSRWALPRHHLVLVSCVHDYARDQMAWPFWFTDLLLLDAANACGVPEPAKTIVWLSVRTDKHRD